MASPVSFNPLAPPSKSRTAVEDELTDVVMK
jgi:hypothetical protein